MIYDICPIAKPRMTQRDKWKKRPVVERYFAFRDLVRLNSVKFESGDHVIFHVPMPDSWSVKKRLKMLGAPHMQTPDLDNFLKGLTDAIYSQDAHLWTYSATKRWSMLGRIEILS